MAEAQEAQAIFMANAHAVSVLGGTGVVGALSGAEQLVTHRFTSALAAVRGEKDALRRYLQAPVSFKRADLHAAMRAELGVPVDTADIGNLIRRSEAAEDVGTSSRE